MQLFTRSLPKILFLLFGGLVMILSLLSANRIFSQDDDFSLTQQQFYFQKEILPDHLLYPLLMIVDRSKLLMADEEQQVGLQTTYAWQRLEHTEILLERGYRSLSFSTLTKAYKYYHQALLSARELELTADQRQALIDDADHFVNQAEKLFTSFTDVERQELSRLQAEQQILKQFFIDSI
jgi:hypothetical protein